MTAYEVFARKYRPQNFDEVLGQEAVATALKNAVADGRTAHAYLFAGPRGVGKTSMARILSKALNCEKGPTPNPCNQCDICQRISAGDDLDVLEIDGASNRGIDEVRKLRQNVRYAPNRARYKIYYIDEVHMLTREAFNALLKTLEEPPAHVKFIFSTTDPQKLPATIHSRCQRFDFRNIPTGQMVTRLKEICSQEGIQAEQEAIEIISRRARGSLRDAESLLDQLASFARDRITTRDMEELLGTIPSEELFGLVDAFIGQDVAGALEVVDRAARKGWDFRELVAELADHLRDLVVVLSAGTDSMLLRRSEENTARLAKQARHFSVDLLLYMIKLLLRVSGELRGGVEGQVLVELAVAKLARLTNTISLEEIVSRLDKLEGKLAMAAEFPPSGPVHTRGLFDNPTTGNNQADTAAPDLSQVRRHWGDLIQAVKEVDPEAGRALEACRLEQAWAEELVVVLPGTRSMLRPGLASLETGDLFPDLSRKILGVPMRLKLVLETDKEVEAAEPSDGQRHYGQRPDRKSSKDALVEKAANIFEGKISRRTR